MDMKSNVQPCIHAANLNAHVFPREVIYHSHAINLLLDKTFAVWQNIEQNIYFLGMPGPILLGYQVTGNN